MRFNSGLVYGKAGGESLLLDIALPDSVSKPLPALLMIHGGGWSGGSRTNYKAWMDFLAPVGIACISIDYRLLPRHRFPAPVEDTRCAVRWIRANAGKYRIDPTRIVALGGSAGAHLTALLGTTGGNPAQSIRAMICMSGPYDLTLGYRNTVKQPPTEGLAARNMLKAFLGGTPEQASEAYRLASPYFHASAKTVPTLLTHGTKDPLVPFEQATHFIGRLKALKVESELFPLIDAGHADFGKSGEAAKAKIIAFLRKHLAL